MEHFNIGLLITCTIQTCDYAATPLLFDFMKVGQNLGNIQIKNSRVRVVSAPSWW